MSLLNNNPGPDKTRVIERALRHRLERHARVNPERLDDILRFAAANVNVRMTPQGWNVVERDVQKLLDEIENRPGWLVENAPRESPMEKLRRANRQ